MSDIPVSEASIESSSTEKLKPKKTHYLVLGSIIITLLVIGAVLYLLASQAGIFGKGPPNGIDNNGSTALPPVSPGTNPTTSTENKDTVTLSLNDTSGKFKISCPAGVVCDENYDYRAFQYNDQENYLYFSFTPMIVGNYSLSNFKEHFHYVHVSIEFPEYSTDDVKAVYQTLNPIRNINFTKFENGNLSGQIEVPIESITLRNDALECQVQDDPNLPEYCYENMEFNKTYIINFEFTVPE